MPLEIDSPYVRTAQSIYQVDGFGNSRLIREVPNLIMNIHDDYTFQGDLVPETKPGDRNLSLVFDVCRIVWFLSTGIPFSFTYDNRIMVPNFGSFIIVHCIKVDFYFGIIWLRIRDIRLSSSLSQLIGTNGQQLLIRLGSLGIPLTSRLLPSDIRYGQGVLLHQVFAWLNNISYHPIPIIQPLRYIPTPTTPITVEEPPRAYIISHHRRRPSTIASFHNLPLSSPTSPSSSHQDHDFNSSAPQTYYSDLSN